MSPIVSLTKHCTKCGEEKPATLEYFCFNRRRKDGVDSICRGCARERSQRQREADPEKDRQAKQRWLQEHPEERREYDRQYRQRNRDTVNEWAREWNAKNREHVRELARKRYNANPEKHRKYQRKNYHIHREKRLVEMREYGRNNPEKGRLRQQRRRAHKLAAGGTYTSEDVRTQLQNQTDRKGIARCWWCGNPLGSDQSVDHRIPLSRGGSNDARNICIAHLKCNVSKKDKMPWEWMGRLL